VHNSASLIFARRARRRKKNGCAVDVPMLTSGGAGGARHKDRGCRLRQIAASKFTMGTGDVHRESRMGSMTRAGPRARSTTSVGTAVRVLDRRHVRRRSIFLTSKSKSRIEISYRVSRRTGAKAVA
jgi:hypothetical protein